MKKYLIGYFNEIPYCFTEDQISEDIFNEYTDRGFSLSYAHSLGDLIIYLNEFSNHFQNITCFMEVKERLDPVPKKIITEAVRFFANKFAENLRCKIIQSINYFKEYEGKPVNELVDLLKSHQQEIKIIKKKLKQMKMPYVLPED